MEKTKSYWYCPNCKEELNGCHVTYQELCEYCGTAVLSVSENIWGDTAPREYGDFCNTTKLPCCGCCPCCEHRITVTSFQSGGDSLDGEARSYMGVYIRQRRTDRADEILAKTDTTNIGSDKRPAGIDRAD